MGTMRIDTIVRLPLSIVAALAIAIGGIGAGLATPPARVHAAAPLPAWDGSVDLYREGAFTTQASWLWCTAAGIQIARNLVFDEDDHRASSQERYFDWMRRHNRYDLPESAGVDPVGWTAGMREFVDDRYRLVSHDSFEQALRLAVTRIRLTELPVALTVAHGGHGWLLTGFSATADPAMDEDFRIRSVRVTGPLFGRQSRNGYDMPPDTSLTPAELERFFTPWRYDPLPMIWDGQYVSIQPVPEAAEPTPAPTPTPTPTPTAAPAQTATPTPRPSAAPTPDPTATGTASPAASVGEIGLRDASADPASPPAPRAITSSTDSGDATALLPVALALALVVLGGISALSWLRSRRSGPPPRSG
jgi:hypothetical protein